MDPKRCLFLDIRTSTDFTAAAAAGLVLCVLILVAWIVYCARGRRSAAKERVKEDFTFNNPAFVSANAKHPDPDINA